MHKLNYTLILVLFIFFAAGCERRQDTDNTGGSDSLNAENNQDNTMQSGVEYNIALNNTGFSPDTIKLTSGVCYQLNFENTGNTEVEFIAGKDPSEQGFDENFFEGMSVENIINDKEVETKDDTTFTGIKLKPGEKGSLAFTPDEDKKGEWLTSIRNGNKTADHRGVIIVN